MRQHPPQEEWVLAAVVVYTPPACRRFLGAVAPRTHFTPPSAAGAGVPSHSYTFRVPKFTHWPRSGLVFCFRLGARRHILARGGALAPKYPLSVKSWVCSGGMGVGACAPSAKRNLRSWGCQRLAVSHAEDVHWPGPAGWWADRPGLAGAVCSGPSAVGSGQWAVRSGQRALGPGQWAVGSGQLPGRAAGRAPAPGSVL